MKLVFEARRHDEYGTIGFALVGKPHMEPLGAMTVAHDCLEHFRDDQGRAEDELMALGAALHVRQHHSRQLRPVDIAADLVNLYHRYNAGSVLDSRIGIRRFADAWAGEFFDEALHKAFKPNSDESETLRGTGWVRHHVRAWLCRGYSRAKRRYPDSVAIGSLFCSIESQVAKLEKTAEAGEILTITFAQNASNARVRLEWPDYEEY